MSGLWLFSYGTLRQGEVQRAVFGREVESVSDAFAGMAPLARHRAVYAALGGMMDTDIHALAIRARAPSEAA